MTFIKCLPRDAAERARNWITFGHMSFEELVSRFNEGCTDAVPSFALEKRWQALVPKSKKWHAVESWFMEFQSMASQVGTLSEEQKIGQFDTVMSKVFPQHITTIYDFEISGKRFSLQ